MVIDIGGTTTDVGVLTAGFPREASFAVDIGGVRTNFRMPDLISIGLGGGSLVRDGGGSIGPDSVGYQVRERALAFGGNDLTATDIAVASGWASLGDRENVANINADTLARAQQTIHDLIAQAIDQLRTSAAPVPVIVVGGGSILVHGDLDGASEVRKPEHFLVANAIGAAIAQVSGEVDQIFSLEAQSRQAALSAARDQARERTIQAGAREETIDIVELEEVPLPYLPSNAVRIRVKMVGEL
jgi:N-methylhydantoinase A/oxoprolinase/acetone carboxylase beta subunit